MHYPGVSLEVKRQQLERGRYRREDGYVVVDVAVKNSRQLFNERDPAPFLERDLDENFAAYVLNSAQEFPLKTPMRIHIVIRDEAERDVDQATLREAIHAYFTYESRLTQAKLRERLRVGRWFFAIGLFALFTCISISQFLASLDSGSKLWSIAREGFVIIGWVAMWRPVELFLYDWWPLRQQRLFLEKVARLTVVIRCAGTSAEVFGSR